MILLNETRVVAAVCKGLKPSYILTGRLASPIPVSYRVAMDRKYGAYLVLVRIHAREGANRSEDILEGVRQLEGVDVAKTELDQAENITTQVDGVSKTRLRAFRRSDIQSRFVVRNRPRLLERPRDSNFGGLVGRTTIEIPEVLIS